MSTPAEIKHGNRRRYLNTYRLPHVIVKNKPAYLI